MRFKKNLIIFSPKESEILIKTFENIMSICNGHYLDEVKHWYPEMPKIINSLKSIRALTPIEWKYYMNWRQRKGTCVNTDYGKVITSYFKHINCSTCKGLGYLEYPAPTHGCPLCNATGWNLKVKELIKSDT